ncbi:hypothetical protein HYW75_05825 [Candidatus Pacearchaeota archaeon]|nr:hypothetical protein [Candidatus Pacearchaeota archaeon]
MNNKLISKKIIALNILSAFLLILLLTINVKAQTLSIINVDAPKLTPGAEGLLRIEIENPLEDDIEDVSLTLDTRNLPLSIVGSSEFSVDEIQGEESDIFAFTIRAATTADAGDYQILFSLDYKGATKPKTGSIGVRIEGNVELGSSVSTDNAIVGREGKITLKIINKGFADARYVSVKLIPNNYIIKSEDEIYIGDIDANDFETASFDVIYQRKNPTINAEVTYKDFENNDKVLIIDKVINVYTKEEALEKGIIKKNNTVLYIILIILIIIGWFVIRSVRRRMRKKKSTQSMNGGK